jgi:VWFA-related protein
MQFVPVNPRWSLRPALALCLVSLALLEVRGQQEAAVFRSGVDLVTIDATVVTRDGTPEPTLGPEDFVLRVDGRRRRVVSAQFVRALPADAAAMKRGAAHFSSNEFADAGRFVVVAVDEPHIRRVEGRSALRAAGDFVAGLDPADHVAVVGLARGGPITFSRDRNAARRQLETLTGHGDPAFLRLNIGLLEAVEIADGARGRLAEVVQRECGRALTSYLNPARIADESEAGRDACPEQVEQEARATAQFARTQARLSLSALEATIAALGALQRPTTLVLLSEGMVADPRLIDFRELSAKAQAARVSIYVLHMDTPLFEAATDRVSPTFVRDMELRADGLSRLAGSARGAVFRLLGGDHAPFQRIASELSGHYLIAFEPLPAERDGRLHRLELEVTRPGTAIRARQAFRIPATVASPRAREEQLVALLRSTLPATELPVRVATYTYVEPVSSNLRVVVSAEADPAGGGDGLVLGYVLVDGRGVIAASGALRAPSGRHAFTARVPRGNYTLRVGGVDPLGRRGMVERGFTAAVRQADDLQVSDLILTSSPTSKSRRVAAGRCRPCRSTSMSSPTVPNRSCGRGRTSRAAGVCGRGPAPTCRSNRWPEARTSPSRASSTASASSRGFRVRSSCASRSGELPNLPVAEAGREVIVHHPDRLHVRIDYGRSHEAEAARLQILAERVGLRGRGRDLPHRAPSIHARAPTDEPPAVGIERAEFRLHLEEPAGVVHGSFDLQPVADDGGILHEALDAAAIEARDGGGIELGEGTPISLSLVEHDGPTEARLRGFEDEKFEVLPIVVRRHAPLAIVVLHHQRLRARPGTSRPDLVCHEG